MGTSTSFEVIIMDLIILKPDGFYHCGDCDCDDFKLKQGRDASLSPCILAVCKACNKSVPVPVWGD